MLDGRSRGAELDGERIPMPNRWWKSPWSFPGAEPPSYASGNGSRRPVTTVFEWGCTFTFRHEYIRVCDRFAVTTSARTWRRSSATRAIQRH